MLANSCPRQSSHWIPMDTSQMCIQLMPTCWGVCVVRCFRRHRRLHPRVPLEMVWFIHPKVIKYKLLMELFIREDLVNKSLSERRILNLMFSPLIRIYHFRASDPVIGQRYGDDSASGYSQLAAASPSGSNAYYNDGKYQSSYDNGNSGYVQKPSGSFQSFSRVQDAKGHVQEFQTQAVLDNEGKWKTNPTVTTTTSKY